MGSKRAMTIKEGDVVQVIRPIFITRVGYPKAVGDYMTQEVILAADEFVRKFDPETPQARSRFFGIKEVTLQDLSRSAATIAREVAYVMAKADGFGGSERKLHTVEVPEAMGQEFYVDGVRTAKTGIYFAPYGTEDGWEPGGLDELKTHRLLRVSTPYASHEFQQKIGQRTVEVERQNVEFVKRPS